MDKTIIKIVWAAITLTLVIVVIWLAVGQGPPPEEDEEVTSGRPVLEAIKTVNKQILIEYYLVVDIQYSEAPEGLLGFLGNLGVKQEFVVLLYGRVPAGFDLERLTESDIWISPDGKRVQLTLPPPVVFEDNASIDFENSRILAQSDKCPGLICPKTMLDAYHDDIMPQGKALIIDTAQQNGILEEAAKGGKTYYEQLLRSLGFEEVQVLVEGYGS